MFKSRIEITTTKKASNQNSVDNHRKFWVVHWTRSRAEAGFVMVCPKPKRLISSRRRYYAARADGSWCFQCELRNGLRIVRVTTHRPDPISLTKCGLPRCIPSFHRALIRRRNEKADKLVRFYLSVFSLSKLILVKKTQYSQFRSITKELYASFDSLLEELRTKVVSLISRYVPSFQSVPLSTGLKWFPIWTASSVPYRYVPGEKLPFHRMIWDLFSVALWDKASLLGFWSASFIRTWPFFYWYVRMGLAIHCSSI